MGAALHQTHLWRKRLAAAKRAYRAAVAHERRARIARARAHAAHRKAAAHRRAAEKRFGVAKAAHTIAMRRLRASKAAAIKANHNVMKHVIKGMKAGHF